MRHAVVVIGAVILAHAMSTSVIAAGQSVASGRRDPPAVVHVDFEAEARSKDGSRVVDARIAPGWNKGRGVQLDRGGSATSVELAAPLGSDEGTIVFWFKPAAAAEGSQPLITSRWAGGAGDSYLAISQGWWEPTGDGRLYFIVSNQDLMHCSIERKLDPDEWQLVAVTWSAGQPGACRIFIDGVRVAEHIANYAGRYGFSGPLYLGSDEGATNRRGRRASGVMDELTVYPRALTEREILQLHERRVGGARAAEEARWRWLSRERARALTDPMRARPSSQSRVLFDEGWQWARSRRDVDRILAKVKRAGFNVYAPCVWHGAGAYFPTQRAHVDPRLIESVSGGEFDPLSYLIERAHAMDIEIHAWFTVVRRDDETLPQFFDAGVPANAYDVHNEAFRDFIVELILDSVRRYPLDGLNLDYIRAMGLCRSERCQQDYRAKTKRNLLADIGQAGASDQARSSIRDWQDAAVADIVRRIALEVRSMDRNVVISVDGHPQKDDDERGLEGRDELHWIDRGWVDVVFNMSYGVRLDLDRTEEVVRTVGERAHALLLANFDMVGTTPVARSGARLDALLEVSSARWPHSAVGVYLANMLSGEQIQALRRGAFRDDVPTSWPDSTSARRDVP